MKKVKYKIKTDSIQKIKKFSKNDLHNTKNMIK